MKLSKKQQKFSEFFVPFLKSLTNCKHFQKKTALIADIFPELPSSKNMIR